MINTILFLTGTIIKILGIILLSLYALLGFEKYAKILFGGLKKIVNKMKKPTGGRKLAEYLERMTVIPGLICIIFGEILTSVAFFNFSFSLHIDIFSLTFFGLFLVVTCVLIYCIRKHRIKEFGTILTLFVIVFAFASAFYASESARYAEETVEWYEDPKPLLCLETSAYYQILDKGYKSIMKGDGYNSTLGVKSKIDSHSTLTLSFYNAGRIPAGAANIILEITNASVSNKTISDSPFPFKILSLTTPVDGFYYDGSRESFIQGDNEQEFTWEGFYRDNNLLDFPPIIDNNYISQLNRNYKLGTIYPQQAVNVSLNLFSTRENADGYLEISIKYCGKSVDEMEIQKWSLPLASQ